MKTFTFLILFTITLSHTLIAQTDTTQSINLLDEISLNNTDTMPLLPKRMLFTQRFLWGEKGLMRNFDEVLTPVKRQNELKIRRSMLYTHQILGFVTLGGMIAQGFVGAGLYNDRGNHNLKEAHESLAVAVNLSYFTTASLSLFAPPKMIDERKGYSSIKLHKALAIVHFTSMLATNILAGQLEDNPKLIPYHRAAAFTAFGAFTVSMITIKF